MPSRLDISRRTARRLLPSAPRSRRSAISELDRRSAPTRPSSLWSRVAAIPQDAQRTGLRAGEKAAVARLTSPHVSAFRRPHADVRVPPARAHAPASPASAADARLARRPTRAGRRAPALVRALLDAAVELRQRDHGHLELARERLEPAGDLADLLDAVLHVAARAHQLQVVDDDQARARRRSAARSRRAFARTSSTDRSRRVVDVQRRPGRAARSPA